MSITAKEGPRSVTSHRPLMPQTEKLRYSVSYGGPAPQLLPRQGDLTFRACLGQPAQLYEALSQKEGWECSSMLEDWFGIGGIFCPSPAPLQRKESIAEACRGKGKDLGSS